MMRERTFIEHLLASQPPSGEPVELDVGDDMAMLRVAEGRVLAAIDAVVEGRHVRPGTDPFAIGRKALLRNLSDVAAMAARPLACLASATLPADWSEASAERLLAGISKTAARYRCPLVGGDTSVHAQPDAPLTVSVAILARPALAGGRVVGRRGAKVGDFVAVTGTLGGSLNPDGGGRHHDFEPRIEAAIELATRLGADLHAMIDLSDGLGVDARHLVEMAESVAIEIEAARLPCTPGVDWRRAVADGEDFELLFTCGAPPPPSIAGVPVTSIGHVVEANGGPAVGLRVGDDLLDISTRGFEHGAGEGGHDPESKSESESESRA